MPSSTQYVPGVTQLDGGLDLANPKQVVPAGSLSNCLNVEVAERVGYKSVDGIERHDGRIGPSAGQQLQLISIVSIPGFFTAPTDIQIGDILSLNGEPWAIVQSLAVPPTTEFPNSFYTNVYVFGKQEVEISDRGYLMYGITLTNTRSSEEFSGSPQYFIQQGRSALDTVLFQNDVYEDVHDTIESLPDGRRAHGLHWFRDRLYAVVNTFQYTFEDGAEEIFPNDIVEDGSGNTAYVRSIELTDGDWGDGDAEGTFTIVSGLNANILSASGAISIRRPLTPPITNAAVITSRDAADEGDSATLWRTTEQEFVLLGEQEPDELTDYGWSPVDMGYVLGFEEGNYVSNSLPSVNRTNSDGAIDSAPIINFTDPSEEYSAPQVLGAGDPMPSLPETTNNNLTETGVVPDDIEGDDGDYLQYGPVGTLTVTTPILWTNTARALTDFSLVTATLPADAIITGVELTFNTWLDVGGADTLPNPLHQIYIRMRGSDLDVPNKLATIPASSVDGSNPTPITFGGPTDTWGRDDLTIASMSDPLFGFDFRPLIAGNNGNGMTTSTYDRRIRFDEIKIKIYYTSTTARLYFWDGADDVSALLTNSNVSAGNFPSGTAVGTLHVYDLTPEGAATRRHINIGDEVRSLPNGEGQLIAVVTSNTYATLPSLNAIVEAKSRYQMITANYYANDAWDAIYGVSGAGRAFVYDQQYFRYIYTGLGDDLDTPRHVEFHIYHLALGYKSGSVLVSVVGEPENYSGVQGAFEISTGDRITGLLSLPGTMLGIGCQSSTWGLAGATVQNFQLQCLKPKEGVLEYTFVDIGVPIACSNTGITVFTTTPAYGDFVNEKMSYSVYPFLYSRLYKQASRGVNQRSVGVVCAIPIKTKGQYLVFFQDGYVLCMSLRGGQQAPQFTLRRYDVPAEVPSTEGLEGYLVPIAHTSQNDSLGRERVFVAHYNPDIRQSNDNSNLLFPFELDRGWSFANNWFDWNYTTNWNYVPQANPKPNDFKVMRKVKLYGLSYGVSHMSCATSSTYEPPTDFKYDVSLPAPRLPTKPQVEMQRDLTPYQSKTASVADRGEFFAISVRNQSPEFSNIKRILPPVVSQVLLQEYDSAREGA